MIRAGLHQAPFLRVTVAVIVAIDLFSFYLFLGAARADALANGAALNAFNALLSQWFVRGGVALIGIAAAIAFGRRPGRVWEGVLALAALALLSTAHAQLFGSPWRHLFFSGLCLGGWLLGLAVSRREGMPTDESYACTGSIALLGAAYLNSGISKIVYGGSVWLSGTPIQVAIIGQDGLVADSVFSAYRSWVVTTPLVASVFSIGTIGFELAGPLMLVGPRIRRCIALGLVAMHANIYLLTTHILYWESMALLALFGLSSNGSSETTVPRTAPTLRFPKRVFAAGVAFLALSAFVAIGHQARRFAHSTASGAGAGELPVPVPTVASLRQIGPLAVGQTLAETWSIVSLRLSDGGVVVTLSGQPGLARFELTCAPSEHRSPFDLGAARIFYFDDLPFRDLEAVGLALQEEVRKAAGGGDICGTLASWLTAAEAG